MLSCKCVSGCHGERVNQYTHVLNLVILVHDLVWLPPPTRYLNWGNLVLEQPLGLSLLGLQVTSNSILVLLLSGEAVFLCTILTSHTHGTSVICIGKTVTDESINKLLMAILRPPTGGSGIVWSVGHGLGSTGNDDLTD